MKRTTLIAAIACACMALPAIGQTVVGTDHDLSGTLPINNDRVCVFCHTPHQPEGTPSITTDPLWNHTLSAITSYGVYASTTLDATPTDIGLGSGEEVSNLCMSCHDGTVGIGSLYNDPNAPGGGEDVPSNFGTMMSGNANMGTDLSNDHPINFTYDGLLVTADGGGLRDPTVSPISGWLFGGTMQCASCHDPHDNTNSPFLVTDNTNSAMCTACHIK